jgi:DNA polymerase I-like protein with 3'-5' exonuclease and polymerase domains
MIVTDYKELKEIVKIYSDFEEVVFDVETRATNGEKDGALDPRTNEIYWISIAGPGRADVIPMGHPNGDPIRWEPALTPTGRLSTAANATPKPVFAAPPEQLWPEEVFGGLEPIFFSKGRRLVNHNIKFDLETIAKYYGGKLPPPRYGETGVMAHLLNENHIGGKPYSLGACVKREIDFAYEKSIGVDLTKVPFKTAARYSYWDAKYTWLLWRELKQKLHEAGFWELFEIEMDVLKVVVRMEHLGVHIDVPAIKKADADLSADILEVKGRINKAAGPGWESDDGEINLNDRVQVRKLIYEIRKHKPIMWTEKTKEPSTKEKAVQIYAEKDPVVADFIRWQELHKLHSTFVVNLRKRLHNGKIHAEFNQRGTKTGRFSSSNPNLQNIPTRKSKVIRDLFVAPPGWKIIVADYSQIELRLLAHYTRDPLLLKAYHEGLDLHTLTACRAYGVKEPTERQRSLAKNVNFSMVYGAGWQTLMDRYEVPKAEAEKLINAFFSTYVHVKPWTQSVIKACKKNRVSEEYSSWSGKPVSPPYVKTLLGRRRRLPEIFFSDREFRGYAERQAVNTVIQGSAGDICKLAMVNIEERFEAHPDWHIILTVHDEINSLVPEADAEEAAAIQKEAMENLPLPVELRVPLVASVAICDRWSEKT